MPNIERLLVQLANDGVIHLYYGPPPKTWANRGLAPRWQMTVDKFGKINQTVGRNLQEVVTECHRLTYSDLPPKPAA